MKKAYPDLKMLGTQQVSKNPDISGTVFQYTGKRGKIGGFGIAACKPKAMLWADIYGTEAKLKKYKPIPLLLFFLGSINNGPNPNVPNLKKSAPAKGQCAPQNYQVNKAAQAGQGGNSEFMERATNAHMWNMMPHLMPSVFQPLPQIF